MRILVGCVSCALLFALAPARAASPPCAATAQLEPSRAFVGQQVLWKVRISSRDDVKEISWSSTPAFSHVRTERLPGKPAAGVETRDGRTFRTREEHRALFAERAGEFEIGPSQLECALEDGSFAAARVPSARLVVAQPPESGRPSTFHGVIGPLVLDVHLLSKEVQLGQSLGVVLSLRGTGNLWNAVDPLPELDGGRAELFRRGRTQTLIPGNRLSVQQIYRYDVVPRVEGSLEIPSAQIVYFNAETERYATATTEAVEVEVRPRAPSRVVEPPRPSQVDPGRSLDPAGDSGFLWWLFAAAAGLIGGGVWLSLRRRKGASTLTAHLDAAARSRESGDLDGEAASLARALRTALAPHVADANGPPDSIVASGGHADSVTRALTLLERIERARFEPNAPRVDRDTVESAIAGL